MKKFNAAAMLLCLSITLGNCDENYFESLAMDVIETDHVYSFFNFSTQWNYEGEFQPQHYRLFPRSLGQLILKYKISELHFTMTQGLWRFNQWGFPYAPSPTGAQIWVWFHENTKNIDKNWVGFTNAFSGLFCASLNFINKAVTVSPKISFRPTGATENDTFDNRYIKYGILARENLCTENLTPWLKLLPCGSKMGPGSLLNPSQLHHSRFLSIGLHFKHDCNDPSCTENFVQLQQHVSVVYDVHSAFDNSPSFSFMSMFNRKVKPACPLATSSFIKIKPPVEATITPTLAKTDDQHFVLDLFKTSNPTNIEVNLDSKPGLPTSNFQGVINHCYLTGIGLDGGLTCSISNHEEHNVTVIFFQVLPWFLYTQLHTLKIKNELGVDIKPEWISFTPAKIRDSPYILELVLTLPLKSVTSLSIQYTRGFLTWTEHPPDANHGFYVSPAVITMRTSDLGLQGGCREPIQRIYSEALLVNIPVPDFSMPYNVICLVCTVLAIAFGSFHNLTTRRFHIISANKVHPVKEKLISFVNRFKRKYKVNSKST